MTSSPPCPQAWLRQQRESSKAYAAFQLFMGLGESRSLSKVAQHLQITRQAVSQMARRWDWEQRARAFDNWQAQEAFDRIGRRLASQADRYSELASAHLAKMHRLEDLGDAALCTRMAADLTRTSEPFAVYEPQPLPPVVLIDRNPDDVAIRLDDGTCGWIPRDRIELAKQLFPTCTIFE